MRQRVKRRADLARSDEAAASRMQRLSRD